MNERYRLDGSRVRAFLRGKNLKHAYLVKELNVSGSLVAQMLSGHVPGDETLKALAALMGVTEQQLLIPMEAKVG